METERAVYKALLHHALPEHEWALYALDQRINDRGVRVDRLLVKNAMAVDQTFSERAFQRAKALTGLENPGSVSQLKAWLADQEIPMESLAKRVVQDTARSADGVVKELLELRLELSKTSIKKYEAMARTVCRDGRVFSETLRGPKGHPRNNFTMAEEKEFFIARTAEFIGAENAAKFADGVEKLEDCADLNDLTALLAGK